MSGSYFDRRRQPSQQAPERPLRRFFPVRGGLLTLSQIRGPWRASGAVAGAGVFAVVWTTRGGEFWAPLHDFTPVDQAALIDACRRLDRQAGYPGAWPDGRCE